MVPTSGDPEDVFDVFHIDGLSYPLNNSSYFVETVPAAKYLAVADDRNAFILLQDFDKCRQHDYLYPLAGPIYATNTPVREIVLFLGQAEIVSYVLRGWCCPSGLIPTGCRLGGHILWTLTQP